MPKVQRREIEDVYTCFPLFSFSFLVDTFAGLSQVDQSNHQLDLEGGKKQKSRSQFFFFDINLLYSFHVPTPACT